jgi:hypothetical protein
MADGVDTGTGQMINMLANPPNPFERAGQSIAGISALRDFQARQATAGLYGQAIDPATGQFDSGKFNALLQASPQALWNAGPAMQQAGTAQAAQGEGTQQQVAAAAAQLHGLGTQMAPLIQKIEQKQQVSPGEAQAALDSAVSSGLVNPQMAAHVKSQIDAIPAGGNANNIVMGANFANSTGQEIANTIGPQFGAYDVGGKTVFLPTGPFWPGSVAGGAVIAHTPSPGEQIQQAQWLNSRLADPWLDPKTHQYRQGTLREWYVDHDIPLNTIQPFGNLRPGPDGTVVVPGGSAGPVRVVAPQASAPDQGSAAPGPSGFLPAGCTAAPPAGTAPPAAPGEPAPPASAGAGSPQAGGVAQPGAQPGAPQAPAAPAPAPNDGRGSVVPAPSSVAAGEAAYNAMRADMPGSQQRVYTAQLALSALRNAKTGPGTDLLQVVNGVLGSWAGGTPQAKAASYDEANKYLQQVANNAVANFGGQATNDKLAAAVTANPSVHVQQLAAEDVLKVMIAGDKMKQYVWQQAQAQGVQPADFANYTANWATTHDPRAFILDQLPQSRLDQLKSELVVNGKLTPDGAKLVNTIKELRTNGQIPDPTRPPG